MNLTANFTKAELQCRCGKCGLAVFHPGFLDELQALRVEFALSMVVTSGARCKEHNDRPAKDGGAGGHVRSLHVCDQPQHPGQKGALAVDIRAVDGLYRGELFSIAWRRGFSIGWGGTFLHLDRRDFVGLPKRSFNY